MTDKDNKPAEKADAPAKKKGGIIAWIVMLVVVAVLSSSGFILGRLMAGSASAPETAGAQADNPADAAQPENAQSQKPSEGTWYYNDLQSVIVNPDEPGATRFVRVALILEVSNELTPEKAADLFQSKGPLLVNWLNLYFKSLSLSEMENDKDIKRILSQVCDGFNEILFPEAKPLIKNVLIREFNIQ